MHTISRCRHCGEHFGTRAALSIHQPGNCRSEKTMLRAGAWKGYGGIWWTPDLGWNDETETPAFSSLQALENKGRKLGQNATLRLPTAPPCLSKFREVAA